MTAGPGVRLAGRLVAAVVFDMDGVVTDTAVTHAGAWRVVLDETLAAWAPGAAPFDPDIDYRHHVDGRPRQDGARAFLAARGVRLPEGDPDEPPGTATVWQVANAKNARFAALVAEQGVGAFASTVSLLRRLRAGGVPVAVVTASRNADVVLAAAGVDGLVDVLVDGGVAERLGLAGKPDPATFREAVRRLGVAPDRAAVVEDALAGVSAGRRGGFAVVVGVDRAGHAAELAAAGADVVVNDLAELDVDVLAAPDAACPPVCAGGTAAGSWTLRFDGFDPQQQGRREVLCAIGNGYLGTRAALPEARADGVHYPGTYLAGVYNRLTSLVGDREVEHEHLVNAPNWLALTVRTPDGQWFDVAAVDLLEHTVTLDLRRARWQRWLRWRDSAGRITAMRQRGYVSMAQRHLTVLECEFTAENWDGPLTVLSRLDADVANTNVADDAALAHRHLTTVAAQVSGDVAILETETVTSQVRIAQAVRIGVTGVAARLAPVEDGHRIEISMVAGAPVAVVKTVATVTSRDVAAASPAATARTLLDQACDAEAIRDAHERSWARLWDRFDTHVNGDEATRLAVRLHTYHLLSSVSAHLDDVDAGMGARGLTGEGYRGHVFWDELFALPVLNLRRPALARALLRYRYRRLGSARAAARAAGLSGAMFPWQSGSDGREETPDSLYNPRTGQWMPDNSHRQRHVGIAVAYNAWQHYQVTADLEFLTDTGGELIIEVARFLAGLARHDPADDRYHLNGVMGPDEFHDGYPHAPGQGLRDNAYTNVMTAWVLDKALQTVQLLAGHHCGEIWDRLGLHEHELTRWEAVSRRLAVPFHADGVISQFDGYSQLEEFDWTGYGTRHGNISRLDLILNAEGDSPNRYRLAKQADTLMLAYLLSADELREVLGRLGYRFDAEALTRTVAFYRDRVSHGSTLSRVVHAWVSARADRRGSWRLFREALAADLDDTQGGTTREGIHLGAMAATLDILQRCYTGLEVRDDALWLHPQLPDDLTGLRFALAYRGQQLSVDVDHHRLAVALRPCSAGPVDVVVDGRRYRISAGETRTFPLAAPAPMTPPPHVLKKEDPMATVTDPVCGMQIDDASAEATITHDGTTYHFCSQACRERFEEHPNRYTAAPTD